MGWHIQRFHFRHPKSFWRISIVDVLIRNEYWFRKLTYSLSFLQIDLQTIKAWVWAAQQHKLKWSFVFKNKFEGSKWACINSNFSVNMNYKWTSLITGWGEVFRKLVRCKLIVELESHFLRNSIGCFTRC